MADVVVYTARIEQDTKDLIQKFWEESGETHAEFFKKIATQLELEQLRQSGSFVEQIEELQLHTGRISDLMLNLVSHSSSLKLMHGQQLKDLETELTAKIETQDGKITQLVEEKEIADAEAKKILDSYYGIGIQMHDTKLALDQANDLIIEYKAKIDELSILAAENQRKAGECNAHVLMVKELENQLAISEEARAKAEALEEKAKAEAELTVREAKAQLANITAELEKSKDKVIEYRLCIRQSEQDKAVVSREADAATQIAVNQVRGEYMDKIEAYLVKQNEYMQEIQQLRLEVAEQAIRSKTG